MPTIHVQPRPTPEERHDGPVEVEVDEALAVHAAVLEDRQELLLRFEERDGIAKVARLTATGLDVELFHILTFT